MTSHLLVFRATVDPANVDRLLAVRPAAIAEAQAAVPELLRADLVRLDERTWLDVLLFSVPDGEERIMAHQDPTPALDEMHALIGDVQAVDRGEVAHTTTAVEAAA